jgi:hypothetical protein
MRVSELRIQNVFALAIGLKVLSSWLGWYIGDPWILGFTFPLLVMAAYIAVGLARKKGDLSDEKFADSCYYMGFIFTITSLVFSLFDLPQIGDRINLIAVRFGAAMISTAAGLAVRVYLVSFRQDATDALHIAEDAIVEAYARCRERLLMTVEKMEAFQSEVELATRGTIERVNMQLEAVGKSCGERLREHFSELALENRTLAQRLFDEMQAATARVGQIVRQYADTLETDLERIDAASNAFSVAMTSRVEQTTFPDDYFSRVLEKPLYELAKHAHAVAHEVGAMSKGVHTAAEDLSSSLQAIRAKTTVIDGALDKVLTLARQQERITALGNAQAERLQAVAEGLAKVDATLSTIAVALGQHNTARLDLRHAISSVGMRLDAKARRIAANVHALDAAG